MTDLRRIEKMLEALLRSEGLIEWVGGYVYGATSNGDPFVILYPAAEHLKEKICRVYPHQFKRLPAFINTANIIGDTDGNPSKDKAQRAGLYHECPPFKIVMHLGKDTQMGREKRFGDVLYVPNVPSGNGPGPQSNGSGEPGGAHGGSRNARDLFDLTYGNGQDVCEAGNSAEQAAFFDYQREHAGRTPYDKAELRRWYKTQERGGG